MIANALPLGGVLFLDWEVFPLVLLFWMENVIVGFFSALKIAFAAPDDRHASLAKLVMVPFFCVHYGMFCFVHGIFLRSFASGMEGDPFGDGPVGLLRWALTTAPHMAWFVMAIITVNAVFYVSDFVLKGGYRTADPHTEMFSPYGRIVTLHVAIILGAGLTIALGQPLLGVLILIALRVVFGVILNLVRRRRLERGLDAVPTADLAST